MRSGGILLQTLHDWARNYFLKTGGLQALKIDGKRPPGREMMQLCVSVCEAIPERPGFYLWGRYTEEGRWQSIYLGKSGFGKTASLRARITEELKDERVCIWGNFRNSREEVFEWGEQLYPPAAWLKFKKHWERSFLKSPATHIIWVSTHLANADIPIVESDLIEALNPIANRQRPIPQSCWQGQTADIFGQLRMEIHKHRPLNTHRLSVSASGPTPRATRACRPMVTA